MQEGVCAKAEFCGATFCMLTPIGPQVIKLYKVF